MYTLTHTLNNAEVKTHLHAEKHSWHRYTTYTTYRYTRLS